MEQFSPWSEEDLKQYQNLDDCISKMASWNGSTPDMIKLYRALVWYAQVRDKIKKTMVSDVKVYAPEEVAGKSKKAPKS